MFITPSFKKSLIVEQFQGNYLKNQNISISSDSVYDSIAYDPVKTTTRLSESRKQKRRSQPIARRGIEHCNWLYASDYDSDYDSVASENQP